MTRISRKKPCRIAEDRYFARSALGQDRRKLRTAAGLDIGRAANDDLGHRQSADHAGNDVARTLSEELAIGWGHALLGVHLVGCLDTQQGFEARNQRDREGDYPHLWVRDRIEVGRHELAKKARQAVGRRHADELVSIDCECAALAHQEESNTEYNSNQRPLDKLENFCPLREDNVPENQNAKAKDTDQRGARADVAERIRDAGESRSAIDLEEREVTLRVAIVAEKVRDLLQDDDDTDTSQHPLDHRGRKVIGNDAGPKKAEDQLDKTGQDDGQEEVLVVSQRGDRRKYDCGEACRRAADADLRSA